MSGHSKWSQIKHQKGAHDVKRGLLFTKLAGQIAQAVKEGGADVHVESNSKLRVAVDKAKAANMPKANIDRAIDRGAGRSRENSLEGILYEGLGPGGVAVLVKAATDNKNRTIARLKNYFQENGGQLLGPGAVSYLFEQMGLIRFAREGKSDDSIAAIAIEVGAQDFLADDHIVNLYTAVAGLYVMKAALESRSILTDRVELIFKPTTYCEIKAGSSEAAGLSKLISHIEGDSDVVSVWTNEKLT